MTSLYDVLKAQKLPTNDAYTGLMAKALKGSEIKEYTGSVPYTFTANGQPLINWIINGASGGVGDKTANLLDVANNTVTVGAVTLTNNNGHITISGKTQSEIFGSNTVWKNNFAFTLTAGTYYFTGTSGGGVSTSIRLYSDNSTIAGSRASFTLAEDTLVYLGFYIYKNTNNNLTVMLNEGSTALPYEPYGFKIPVSCGGTTTNIYLGEPLGQGDSISKASTGIDIPTADGSNTLSVGTAVQPSGVYIKYKR